MIRVVLRRLAEMRAFFQVGRDGCDVAGAVECSVSAGHEGLKFMHGGLRAPAFFMGRRILCRRDRNAERSLVVNLV